MTRWNVMPKTEARKFIFSIVWGANWNTEITYNFIISLNRTTQPETPDSFERFANTTFFSGENYTEVLYSTALPKHLLRTKYVIFKWFWLRKPIMGILSELPKGADYLESFQPENFCDFLDNFGQFQPGWLSGWNFMTCSRISGGIRKHVA